MGQSVPNRSRAPRERGSLSSGLLARGDRVQLAGLRVRHFRTIGDREVALDLSNSLTIVGPNNSGKTNILRAVEMFFTGHDNVHNYAVGRDLTFGSRNARTSLLATFVGDSGLEAIRLSEEADSQPLATPATPGETPAEGSNDDSSSVIALDSRSEDAWFYSQFDRLHELYQAERTSDTFTLSLQFSPAGNPIYQFFPNRKKPNASQNRISTLQRQLVTDLLESFSCHYIPSEKSIAQLYDEVLNPFLRVTAARAVEPQLVNLTSALEAVSRRINDELEAVGLQNLKASFDLPNGGLEQLLNRFSFNMRDPHATPIANKGQGIQSTAFLAALRWVTEEERKSQRNTIWLLEEPESYLHPELMPTVRGLLGRLAKEASVITSTHSLAFVPNDVNQVRGTFLGASENTELATYRTAVEAGSALRAALGIRFSDYYNLGVYNVATEGESDREMLRWYLSLAPEDEMPLTMLRQAEIQDHGGVKFLAGWLRATYPHIRRERALVALFDGDAAGEKERRDLVGYLGGQEIPFQPNQQYVIVRSGFPIEALFPDQWLVELASEHENWFDDFVTDASGDLHSMKMKDNKKSSIQGWLQRRAMDQSDAAWRSRFDDVARALDAALAHQHARCAMPPDEVADSASGSSVALSQD